MQKFSDLSDKILKRNDVKNPYIEDEESLWVKEAQFCGNPFKLFKRRKNMKGVTEDAYLNSLQEAKAMEKYKKNKSKKKDGS